MFFHESESIARDEPALANAIELIDQELSQSTVPALFRPGDFASALGLDGNQVASVFELLADQSVLSVEQMVECDQCFNLMSAESFRDALADEDDLECSGCGCLFPRRAVAILIYSLTDRSVARIEDRLAQADPSPRPLPDPDRHTTGKFWTTQDGSIHLSTKTNAKHDGTVTFSPTVRGQLSLQMRFMQVVCFKHPDPVMLGEVIRQVYPDVHQTRDARALKTALGRLRSLVSDIRKKKFKPAGLNPDILQPLSVESSIDSGIRLRLAQLHKLDDSELDEADEAPAIRDLRRQPSR